MTHLFSTSRLYGSSSSWLQLILILLAAAPALAQAPADAGTPHVIRTFVHHQITNVDRGIIGLQPVISSSGNRIVFGLRAAADGGTPRLAAVDFSGANLVILDTGPVIEQPHTNADGSRVVYVFGYNEIRIVGGDGSGRRTLVTSGAIICPRLSGDGHVIVFVSARGMTLRQGDKSQDYIRGVYAIDPDGNNLRLVAGPEQIGKLRGVDPNTVGNPNFDLVYDPGSLDISSDGGHVAFGCWVNGASVLFGCDINGANLHTIAEHGPKIGAFGSIALSGDASTVAFHTVSPDSLGVVGFDGKGERSLLRAGDPEDRRFSWGGAPVYITLDGARVTYAGRHFNADGSGTFELLSTHQGDVLRYLEYPQPAADGTGRRFAYWGNNPQPAQLATMELDVPWDHLGSTPRISDLLVDPPTVPRLQDGVQVVPTKAAARVTSTPAAKVSTTAFLNGLIDEKAAQNGSIGNTDLLDDGKVQDSGDEKAGDGIFTRRWVAVAADAPDGPRTLRFEAQITGADGLRHASVVEVGPFPVVPGSAQPQATQGTPIDGTPPLPPTLTPHPGTVVIGPTTPTTPTGPTDPPNVGAVNLTGYWRSDTGATYYLRQIGDKLYWYMDALPDARNIFTGTIADGAITGAWVDLPGGTRNDTGTLKIKIESNDKLTKISDSIPYNASSWSRIAKPPGASAGISMPPGAVANPPTVPPAVPPAAAEPFNTPAGQAAIDQWITLATAKLNTYDGGATFNDLKPWGIHPKYGTLTNKKATSAFAPDNFPRYNNNRYWYIWDHYTTDSNGRWSAPQWNAAGVPDLHDFVMKALKK